MNVDVKHKRIRDYEATSADVHDGQVLDELFDPDNTGKAVWAESAYTSEEIDKKPKRRAGLKITLTGRNVATGR